MRIPGKALIHTALYFLHLDGARTQTTDRERAVLQRYAQGKRRALEIGVYEGVSTRLIAGALGATSTLYAVDPFLPGLLRICWGEVIARSQVRRAGVHSVVHFVKAFSHEAASLISGSFDFVFIDGDHSDDAIARDWSEWSPRVAPDGIIALHDTRVPPHNPAVAELGSHRYFMRHIRHDIRFTLIAQVDSLSVLRRNGR